MSSFCVNNASVLPQRDQSTASDTQEPEGAQSSAVSVATPCSDGPGPPPLMILPPQIGDTHSPAAATTAEEAMSVSHDMAARETRPLPGDLGALGGAAPLGGDMAGAEGGSEETSGESETWAASVPPVRAPS